MDMIKRALQYHGTLFAFTRLSSFPDGTFRVLAEYCSAASAIAAVKATDIAQLIDVSHFLLPVSELPLTLTLLTAGASNHITSS